MRVAPQSSQLLDMAAERRRAAGLDRAHDAPLDAPEMAGMRLTIGLAVAAEDIRHLQSLHAMATRSAGRHHLQRQPVERARRVAGSSWSRPACSAPWSTGWCGRAAPG